MKPLKQIVLMAIVILTILSLLLSACGPIDNSGGNPDNGKSKDKDKGNDQDKENDQGEELSSEKVTICHRTGSAKNPYVEITVSSNAANNGHAKHGGDLIPAPEGGCPDTAVPDVPAK